MGNPSPRHPDDLTGPCTSCVRGQVNTRWPAYVVIHCQKGKGVLDRHQWPNGCVMWKREPGCDYEPDEGAE